MSKEFNRLADKGVDIATRADEAHCDIVDLTKTLLDVLDDIENRAMVLAIQNKSSDLMAWLRRGDPRVNNCLNRSGCKRFYCNMNCGSWVLDKESEE